MNIALIGYGKMGKELDRLAHDRKISVVAHLNSQSRFPAADVLDTIDVAIHFATPQTVLNHVEEWGRKKKNLVIGTTGWQADLAKVRAIVEKEQIGLIYASNFSFGVNVFNLIVRQAGAAFDKFPEYDAIVHETHHRDKPDSPSGTALTLANILLKTLGRKKEIRSKSPEGKINPEQLHVSSTRIGSVIGTHRVVFDSDADQIELIHTAKNRSGFALGSLLAAEWIRGKKGFFTMDDMLDDVLK
jgi:4-hydroxy-tetrahydrodipicolinate reductase